MPKEIRDLEDQFEIEIIKKEIISTIQRKNKNLSVINYDKFYIIDEKKVIVIQNKIIEKSGNKKKYKKNEKSNKIPIEVISVLDEEDQYLIEIKKNLGVFEEGELYVIY